MSAATTTVQQPAAAQRRAPGRRTALLIVLVVVTGAALAVWAGRGSGHDGPLDPRNPGAAGAEATARVLADQGVDVDVARGEDALLSTDVDAGTEVVVTNPQDLGESTLRTLQRHTRSAGALVLVGNGTAASYRFPVSDAVTRSGVVEAGCQQGLVAGLRIDVADDESGYDAGPRRCFDGLLFTPDAQTRWLLADSTLRNDRVARADNAALALRLLGQQPRLVWYVADPADLDAADGVSIRPLLPPWLIPGLVLLGLAGVALLLWQARRLGPLVTEPLPVVVRAAESTDSRGWLYHRSRDRDHAARVLRAATRRRVAARLALPVDATSEAVVLAAATALARPLDPLRDLLEDRAVRSDSDLADLGRDLLRLEEEVHAR